MHILCYIELHGESGSFQHLLRSNGQVLEKSKRSIKARGSVGDSQTLRAPCGLPGFCLKRPFKMKLLFIFEGGYLEGKSKFRRENHSKI